MNVELFESAELSDVGRKRKNNEDACLRIPEKGVYCVADGMGGVVGGDLASEAITTNVHEAFAKAPPEQYDTLAGSKELLRAAVNKASNWIKEFADEKVIGQMGSTLVGLVFDPRNPSCAMAMHAGDSRLYRWRNGNLEQLTADHTAAAALAAKLGRDSSTFPAKYHNELARAVGLKESVELEETKVQAKCGDVFLLCSDGLPRMVPDKTISKVLAHAVKEDLATVARELIQQANEAGGKDNVTVVLVKIGDISSFANMEPEPEDEPMTVAAPVASESNASLAAKEIHSPPTPDTERPARDYTPTPQKPPSASRQKEGAPSTGNPSRKRAPMIAGAIVVFAAGVLACFHFAQNKPSSEEGKTDIANFSPSQQPGFDKPIKKPEITPKPVITPPVPVTGGLVLQSDPEGAGVYSNNQVVGVTPYAPSGLPPGQLTYQLGTITQTGMVVAAVVAGATNTNHVTLTPRTGTVAVNSDPTNAEVWVDGQAKGTTPVSLNLEAGDRPLLLKYPPLLDQTVPWTVVADTSSQTSASFAYGGVVIVSDPPGAEVRWQGHLVGHAPLTTNLLLPGPMTFQLIMPDYMPSNVTAQVPADHSLAKMNVKLQHVPIAPPVTEVRLAANTNTPSTTNAAAPETKPPAATNLVGTGRVRTNDLGRVTWIGWGGMVFLKMPSEDLWVEIAPVTAEQFEQVAGHNAQELADANDNKPHPEVALARAELFATNLTRALQKNNELPAGYENWRLAIPTSDEWMLAATNSNSLGLKMENSAGVEWCRNVSGPRQGVFFGRYMPAKKTFFAGRVESDEAPQTKMALRLVLVPPEPPSN